MVRWRWMIPLILTNLSALLFVPGAWAQGLSEELDLAQRYFSARKTRGAHDFLLSSGAELDERCQRWAKKGSAWQVEVSLFKAQGRERAASHRPDLWVEYRVIEQEFGPICRWVVELSSPSWPKGFRWEQEVLPERSLVRIRGCDFSRCGAWMGLNGELTVFTAGNLQSLIGIQAPLFLDPRSLQRDWRQQEWSGEDFFGRPQGWVWPSRVGSPTPWPTRLFNAQAEVRLISESPGRTKR